MKGKEMKYHVALSDTDLYKFTMGQAISKLFPHVLARYTFIDRRQTEFPEGFGDRLQQIIDEFQFHELNIDELTFLKEHCPYLDKFYLEFLSRYSYNPKEVSINQKGSKLEITIEGLWFRTVLWEVPLMATISELYFEMTGQKGFDSQLLHTRNQEKAIGLSTIGAYYSEFGTRRRFSFENQKLVLDDLKKHSPKYLIGTSNVYLAMLNNLKPIGTVAHEWFQFHGARYSYLAANEMALENWVKVYNGSLGIALTDTFTTDVFFKTFNTKYAKMFDGLRQDSGLPQIWLEKTIDHYENLGIDTSTKTAMFSDNLKSIEQIEKIHISCKGKIQDRYGIGTWLSNDVGINPLNMVIKLTNVDFGDGWKSCVKLSDDIGKNTGNVESVNICKKILDIEDIIE